MLPRDIFLQLPRPTALLLLSSILSLTSAHVARQTPTSVPHRPLNVVAYPPPPAPTSPPLDAQALRDLLRRQDTNTVCGYINGDPSLPATCSAGSHCVVDTDHGVIGCCPNGQSTCTAGVYTGCVDSNSSPQTEVNPYVYTCTGSSVCYKNIFEGGYSQFGCGSASSLAASVAQGATGIATEVSLTSEGVSFTQSATSLDTPTPIGTGASTLAGSSSASDPPSTSSASSSDASSVSSKTTLTIAVSSIDPNSMTLSSSSSTTATTSSSSSSSSGASSSSTSTSTPTAAPATSGGGTSSSGGVSRTGAIVGGSIGGVAALAGLVAVAAYLLRRRAGNSRQGPGPRPGDTQYISPMSGGGGFAKLGQGPDGRGSPPAMVNGRTIRHVPGSTRNTVWQYGDMGHQDAQFLEQEPRTWGAAGLGTAAAAGAGAGAFRGAYASPHDSPGEDQIPLWRQHPEIDDFSRNFNDALSRIGEEDEEDIEGAVNNGGMSGNHESTGDMGESRPLWLQSRRQSRNLMWT